ncbi:MAG: HAMP domain-containing sensor histidine kinase [Anaerolineales bacterium]|nr:HAMP domain-containing sensor histidine kinase [Anaerolineales bacterium]
MNDLSNSKEDRDQVRDRLQELDHLKNSFVALVSHELRTPANLISGYLDLGLEALQEDNLEAKEYLEVAQKNTRRIIRIIQELTDFARLQRGKSVDHLNPIPIMEAVRQTVGLLDRDLNQKKLELTVELSSQFEQASYDGESLIVIFRNILSNAAKFSPESGEIQVIGKVSGDKLMLEFIDQADPIPESKKDLIFEDFRQIENYLTRRYEGMGLGLAVARRSARFLGGDIELRVLDSGNIFTVILPAPKPPKMKWG